MFAVLLLTLLWSNAPPAQLLAVGVAGSVALSMFSWEAWRGRNHVISERGLLVSLALTELGISVGCMGTGGALSPLVLMMFAPAVVGFAAFGRGRSSDTLLVLALFLLGGLALVPAGIPFPAFPEHVRRFLIVVCAADALLLLRLGVSALTDAHAAVASVAAGAGDDVVAAAAARANAMEAMGAKVAHEVRNPLSAIRALVEVVAEKNTDEKDHKRLDVVLGEVDRIDEILRGYLALARPLDSLVPRVTDIAALVREVAAVLEMRSVRANVALELDVHDATAEVDPRRVKEALLNLVLNALDATPAGGHIHLKVLREVQGPVILVMDSGPGMDDSMLQKAGQLFSSSREGGTGIGLAIARQAIAQHGGTLELTSRHGAGTTARVWLPWKAQETA